MSKLFAFQMMTCDPIGNLMYRSRLEGCSIGLAAVSFELFFFLNKLHLLSIKIETRNKFLQL